jgi:membrane associated rhomboid family serine protease
LRTARFGPSAFRFGLDITPTVRRLLVANFAVWLVQLGFAFAHRSGFEDLFALHPNQVLPWRPWQFLTYMFLHSAPSPGSGGFNPLHIIFNMLMLAMLGGAVERQMGERRFLRYYLVCGVAGGVLTLVPGFRAVTLGASGAVLGVLTAFGLFFPNQVVVLLVFPMRAKVMVVLLALLNLFSAAAGGGGNIAVIAHLGGMAAGFAWLRGGPFVARLRRTTRARRQAQQAAGRAELKQRMDDVLDKMNREGRESLTQDDWRTLLAESRRLRDKRNGGTP